MTDRCLNTRMKTLFPYIRRLAQKTHVLYSLVTTGHPTHSMKKIAFKCFWPNFTTTDQFYLFAEFLHANFHITVTPDERDADIVFYSIFCSEPVHLDHTKKNIFYTGENLKSARWAEYKMIFPEHDKFDFYIGFNRSLSRNTLRAPVFLGRKYAGNSPFSTLRQLQKPRILVPKKKFCIFLQAGKSESQYREKFCLDLMRYKPIECPGRILNNCQPLDNNRLSWDNKIEHYKQFKFAFAFENSVAPGYTTEKLVEALLGNTVPLYWGDPTVDVDFDKKTFICRSDFGSDNEMIEYIKFVDQNKDEYEKYFMNPPLISKSLADERRYIDFFAQFLDKK